MKHIISNPNKLLQSQHGIGIIEVLVAILILGFIMTAISKTQVDNRKFMLRTKHREEASQIATSVLDSLKREGLATITAGSRSVAVDRNSFKKTFRVSWTESFADTNYLNQPLGKQVSVNVQWASSLAIGKIDSLELNGVVE